MGAASTWSLATALRLRHLIHRMLFRVDLAWQTGTLSVTLDAHPKIGHLVPEWSFRLEVDWVPSQRDEGIALFVLIRAGDVG